MGAGQDGQDVLDLVVAPCKSLEGVVDVAKEMERGPDLTFAGIDWAAFIKSAEQDLNQGKEFTCMCTAWDMMLTGEEVGKRQRRADFTNWKEVAAKNCKDVNLALTSLLERWAGGADVCAMLP